MSLRRNCHVLVRLSVPALLAAALVPAVSAQQTDSVRVSVLVLDEAKLLGLSAAHVATSPLRWGEPELRTVATAAIGIFALSSLDEAGRAFMLRQQSTGNDHAAAQVERLGTVENFYILGAFFLAGVTFDDARARSVAAEGLASSLLAAGVITPTLQRIAGRSRPRKEQPSHTFNPWSGSLSFPSGHTTQAFAVASVIATEYDHPAVQVVAYGLAGGVAASRMYHGAHFVSDVTAAALIGTVVGRSVAHYGQSRRAGHGARALLESNAGDGVRVGITIVH
ncbi:MAG TPA: phosphatase PAP2 family protein [Longimicrobiales bacterium]|nr:phosphatase PAP2 family protein [Longimicrobiales bacterium]